MSILKVPAGRSIIVIAVLAFVAAVLALVIPLGSSLPLVGGGGEAREASCGPAIVAWSDEPPGTYSTGELTPDARQAFQDGQHDAGVCSARAEGRITMVVIAAAIVGGALVLADVGRSRRSAPGPFISGRPSAAGPGGRRPGPSRSG